MSTKQDVTVRVPHRYKASPERVFDAWLNPVLASHWLFATASRPLVHVEIDARVEGSFRFVKNGVRRANPDAVQQRVDRQ